MFIVSLETLAVIPARMASTRLPGKPLIEVGGVPLILRVSRGVRACPCVDRVIVATDDERIAETVEADGGEAMMTPEDLPSGGDRVAWVSRRVPSQFVVNVQGDDPLVGPDMIEPLVAELKNSPDTRLALLVRRIEKAEEVSDPNIVKVVFDISGRAFTSAVRPFRIRAKRPAPCGTSISVLTHGGAIFCSTSRPAVKRLWRSPKVWRCCACLNAAIPSAASRRRATRSRSTRRMISGSSKPFSRPCRAEFRLPAGRGHEDASARKRGGTDEPAALVARRRAHGDRHQRQRARHGFRPDRRARRETLFRHRRCTARSA